jgi:hypothetical protein
MCGRPCRPCSCSHKKYATPATSTRFSPPPKGRPGALGMRGGITVHLSIDTAARSGGSQGAIPFSVAPSGRIDRKDRRRCPGRPTWLASLTAPGLGDLAPGQVGVSDAMLPVLVIHRARDRPFGAAAASSPSARWIEQYGLIWRDVLAAMPWTLAHADERKGATWSQESARRGNPYCG